VWGITGVVFVELNGGSAKAKNLVDATPPGQIPEIGYEKNSLTAFLDELPKVVARDLLFALDSRRPREACPRMAEAGAGDPVVFVERHWIPAEACPERSRRAGMTIAEIGARARHGRAKGARVPRSQSRYHPAAKRG
jgi:hypothetical protein